MHESSEELDIRRDSTTDYGVSFPLASEKSPYTYTEINGVATFSQLFLVGSFSYLQTYIYKSLDEFESRPDLTPGHRVTCP